MSRITPSYALALLRAARPGDLVHAAVGRALARPGPANRPALSIAEARRAADALDHAPRLFTTDPLAAPLRERFPTECARLRRRAEQMLDGEIEIFGRPVRLCALASDLPEDDPKWRWEVARGGWLVELAAAARRNPALAPAVRAATSAWLERFFEENPPGEGIHYDSPLEVAVRELHVLATLELGGGACAFPRRFVEQLATRLAFDGWFLAGHLESSGVAPANHLLGDYVGLLAIGLALDERGWQARARAGLVHQARRQVERDGAHFEASTAYHRFALELLLFAQLLSSRAGAPLPLARVLHRMFFFTRAILAPDGSEPGFGDSDDARLVPLVPRAPHDHSYLPPLGAILLGEPALKLHRVPLCEEALWLFGAEAARSYDRWPGAPPPASASFPAGGVHVLRSGAAYVALRSGPYGQRGVGGHAHNDQLALVVHARGRPLIVDSGTGRYTGDALTRDRFRGTAAHATVVVDGEEQVPLFGGRPFALPQLLHTARVRVEDCGERARIVAAHDGYLRLPERVIHERQVILHRAARLLVIEDRFDGRGSAAIELRFPLAGTPRRGAGARTRARLQKLEPLLGPLALAGQDGLDRVVEVEGRAALIALGPPLALTLSRAPRSPRYGTVRERPLVAWAGRLILPSTVRVAVLL